MSKSQRKVTLAWENFLRWFIRRLILQKKKNLRVKKDLRRSLPPKARICSKIPLRKRYPASTEHLPNSGVYYFVREPMLEIWHERVLPHTTSF